MLPTLFPSVHRTPRCWQQPAGQQTVVTRSLYYASLPDHPFSFPSGDAAKDATLSPGKLTTAISQSLKGFKSAPKLDSSRQHRLYQQIARRLFRDTEASTLILTSLRALSSILFDNAALCAGYGVVGNCLCKSELQDSAAYPSESPNDECC